MIDVNMEFMFVPVTKEIERNLPQGLYTLTLRNKNWPPKKFKQKFIKYIKDFVQLFSEDAPVFSKNYFPCLWAQKLLIINPIFLQYCPELLIWPKIENPYRAVLSTLWFQPLAIRVTAMTIFTLSTYIVLPWERMFMWNIKWGLTSKT